ncbi:hypothetical protein NDU88_002828 [Pleurodeles waltl]|uniref:Uncharacterized protein n=1 Tax=Pleurodeles waltl TaxID=8319 RepID=A0AAV7L2D7_PLEWA|nr:hypothetical protein NDU88_002828 [Pleurodeles waltl]
MRGDTLAAGEEHDPRCESSLDETVQAVPRVARAAREGRSGAWPRVEEGTEMPLVKADESKIPTWRQSEVVEAAGSVLNCGAEGDSGRQQFSS